MDKTFKGLLNWIGSRLQSKKFTVWLSGMIVIALQKQFGWALDPEQILIAITAMSSIYLGAQGYADGKSGGATSAVSEAPK